MRRLSYFYSTALNLPFWVYEGNERSEGVLRVLGYPNNEIYIAKGINDEGSLLPFPAGDSGVSDGQSVLWSSV